MNVVIRSIQDQDAVTVGIPALHLLKTEKREMRAWVKQATYELPIGYCVRKNGHGCSGIYNAAGHHCALLDSKYGGVEGGSPVLVDPDLPQERQMFYLRKVYDMTFDLLKEVM